MSGRHRGQGTALDRVADWFGGQDAMPERLGDATRESLDEVLDTPRTGRIDPAPSRNCRPGSGRRSSTGRSAARLVSTGCSGPRRTAVSGGR